MNKIKELNLKEVAYLTEKFGITFSGDSFNIVKTFSEQDVYDAIIYLQKEIWNRENVIETIEVIKNKEDEDIFYYWPPEQLEPIDDFLGKSGMMDYKVVIADPLSWICSINPNSEHSPEKNPGSFLKILLQNSLYLHSLTKWIETDQLLLIPDIHLWDYSSWVNLGKLNEEIMTQFQLETTDLGKEMFKIGTFEAGVAAITEMGRLIQNNADENSIKKAVEGIDEIRAKKTLKHIKKMSKEKRDEWGVRFIAEKFEIEDALVVERLERLKKQSIFHVENYVDISKLTDNINIRHSMPLTLALYIENELNVIPITDYKLNKLTFDMYAQVIQLSDAYKDKKELIESKVDIEASFLEGLSPEFVAKQKISGAATNLRKFLSKEWKVIRETNDSKKYLAAIDQFSKSVGSEYAQLKNEMSQLKRELAAGIGVASVSAGGVFIEETIRNNYWMAAGRSIPALLLGTLKSVKKYDSAKFNFKKNPLFIFIDKKLK